MRKADISEVDWRCVVVFNAAEQCKNCHDKEDDRKESHGLKERDKSKSKNLVGVLRLRYVVEDGVFGRGLPVIFWNIALPVRVPPLLQLDFLGH